MWGNTKKFLTYALFLRNFHQYLSFPLLDF